MAYCLRAFSGRTCLDGWQMHMRSGFAIQSHYWKICLQIPTSRMSLTTHPIKSMPPMGHIDSVTSCQATGPGNKWYVYLFIYPYVSACSHFIIIQDTIIKDHPEAIGSFLISTILGSDKMTISIATGHMCYWPLYLSIGNIHNNIHCGHWNGVVLLGFLAIPKSVLLIFDLCFFCTHTLPLADHESCNDIKYWRFHCQLLHTSLWNILKPIRLHMTSPKTIHCMDGHYHWAIFSLGYILNNACFQALFKVGVHGISIVVTVLNWFVPYPIYSRCTAPSTNLNDGQFIQCLENHTELLCETCEMPELWDKYGIVGDIKVTIASHV